MMFLGNRASPSTTLQTKQGSVRTGRWVSFEAEFADRFRVGELVEHTGWVDTEGLLRQLGHHREG
jgi:hypothetical protein